ncbi:hypothetical protein RHMOL_Rhmol07G0193000 [Rhododendron molle]|uniref:Uncharacterized protein n=1 Tax=Rhododendron molle TaxID=49168 RepID=A0ACC0N2L8_RHOML|nr:hypothetical protein RHMOL_Rhmol07G0193000 [Rhododendron molle]
MNHIVNLVAGAHQLKITIESMTTQLMGKLDYIVTILAEIRDFKRVQRHTPTPVEDDSWFPVMFPILCAFYGFFGALPPMENFTYGEEETGDEKVTEKATKEGEASGTEAMDVETLSLALRGIAEEARREGEFWLKKREKEWKERLPVYFGHIPPQ